MKMRVVIGIDPGLKGWMVAIGPPAQLYGQATPILNVAKKGTKHVYDVAAMAQALRGMCTAYGGAQLLAVLEKQQAMPKTVQGRTQGVASSFHSGHGYGLWEGLLAGLGIPYVIVHPRTWQSKLLRDVPGDDTKARAILRAGQLFPSADLRRSDRARKPDHNKADAILLAYYGQTYCSAKATVSPAEEEVFS